MSYFRGMEILGQTLPKRWSAVALAAALAVSACGSTTAPDSQTNTEELETTTTTAESESNEAAPEADGETVSLGEREAGFGRGSLAVLAGEFVERLEDVEGDWFPGPPFPLDPPDVCGVPEAAALQNLVLVRPVDQTGVRGDVITAEVRIYDTAAEAEALVDLINGDSAEACDQASAELALESTTPGVSFDLGDGVGEPGTVPDNLPEGIPAASRSYDFEVVFGSVGEALVQKSTVAVVDTAVISFSVSASAEIVDDLEAEVVEALFTDPAPEIIESPDLDVVIDNIRRSVLSDSDLPDFYDPGTALLIGSPGSPDVCFTADSPVAATFGPSWISISPGIGSSEVRQGSRIYSDSAAASAAFEEVASIGVECFPEELAFPDEFELVSSAAEELEIGGTRVVHVELDYVQSFGGQTFDVDVKIAVAQFGEVLTSVRFFGLAGDSPELPELVALAAQQGAGRDS